MKEKFIKQKRVLVVLLAILAVCVILILFTVFIEVFKTVDRKQFEAWLSDLGGAGLIVMFGVQVVQIIIAVIPGEPVEVMAGMLYGTAGGTLMCLSGCIVASTLIFRFSEKYGKRLLRRLFSEEKVQNWGWLQEGKRMDTVTFLLFLIPGTPKDMLTYVVAVSEMPLNRFLVISTIARIPSVVMSALTGATMRQGEWKMAVLIFGVTIMIGITAIFYQQKVVAFCRRNSRAGRPFIKSGSLDFAAAAHRDRIVPIIYGRISYDGMIDPVRLKEAVRVSAQTIPEILCVYDFRRGRFADAGFTVNDVVRTGTRNFDLAERWPLDRSTQLKIWMNDGEMIVGISHILCDGVGFLQYLYLLASLYNGPIQENDLSNNRDITLLLKGVKAGSATQQEKAGKNKYRGLFSTDQQTAAPFCLQRKIASAELTAIHCKARNQGASINDVLLTAYARVLAKRLNTDRVVLPCPANLRRYGTVDNLTVANMTGMYQVVVEVEPNHCFDDTLVQVHLEMCLQKERKRCFRQLGLLHRLAGRLPASVVNWLVKHVYHILPLSYSNIGVIESDKLLFAGARINDCFLTGAYRYSPDFQLSVSTFKNICTLNCTMIGGGRQKLQAQEILDLVVQELAAWMIQ